MGDAAMSHPATGHDMASRCDHESSQIHLKSFVLMRSEPCSATLAAAGIAYLAESEWEAGATQPHTVH